jgi:hypothetical protein
MLTMKVISVDKILYWESSIGLCRYRIKISVNFTIFSANNARPKIHVCWYVMPCRLVHSCEFWMARIAFVFRVKRSKKIS